MILLHLVLPEGQNVIVELFKETILALIPIWLYGGRKGKSGEFLRYRFYAFYPAHMLILYLIRYSFL